MKELKRTQVGNFYINNSYTIKQLEENKESAIISIEDFLKNKEKILLEGKDLNKFLNGVKILNKNEDGIYTIYSKQEFIGTGVIKGGILKRDIII